MLEVKVCFKLSGQKWLTRFDVSVRARIYNQPTPVQMVVSNFSGHRISAQILKFLIEEPKI